MLLKPYLHYPVRSVLLFEDVFPHVGWGGGDNALFFLTPLITVITHCNFKINQNLFYVHTLDSANSRKGTEARPMHY